MAAKPSADPVYEIVCMTSSGETSRCGRRRSEIPKEVEKALKRGAIEISIFLTTEQPK